MINKSLFSVLIDLNKNEIPIFIPTFNQTSLLEMTISQLNGYDGKIIIYDNNSTFQPMIDLLNDLGSEYEVVLSGKNSGPRIFTEDMQILGLMPDYFIVTDPDLINNKNLPRNYVQEMKKIIDSKSLAKVGFAIEIYDEQERSNFLDEEAIVGIEEIYWKEQIGVTSTSDRIFNAAIDTTFSLNKRDACVYHRKFNKPTFMYPSARIADSYTCRHIGWWKKELMPQSNEEKEFYYKNQTWSHTERYYYK